MPSRRVCARSTERGVMRECRTDLLNTYAALLQSMYATAALRHATLIVIVAAVF